MCSGGDGKHASHSKGADQSHFHGNSLDAGSAFTKVTFVDDQALQLLCDYY
jgi:hypothetical protein